MREMLFRGKSENANDWIFGSLVYSPQERQYYIAEHQENEWQFPVFTDTIGQYTGLKDKNGTKIFEGDIVKLNAFVGCDIAEIKMRAGYFEMAAYCKPRDLWQTLHEKNNFEIIGNVFDNPELLDVGK